MPGVARCATVAGRRERTGAAAPHRLPEPRLGGLVERAHRRSRLFQRTPLAGQPHPECLAVAHCAGQGSGLRAHRFMSGIARSMPIAPCEDDLGIGTGQDLDRDLQEDGERPECPGLAVTCIKPYSGSNALSMGRQVPTIGTAHPVTISIMEVLNERRKDHTRRA